MLKKTRDNKQLADRRAISVAYVVRIGCWYRKKAPLLSYLFKSLSFLLHITG